jgi:hypothetical protein
MEIVQAEFDKHSKFDTLPSALNRENDGEEEDFSKYVDDEPGSRPTSEMNIGLNDRFVAFLSKENWVIPIETFSCCNWGSQSCTSWHMRIFAILRQQTSQVRNI